MCDVSVCKEPMSIFIILLMTMMMIMMVFVVFFSLKNFSITIKTTTTTTLHKLILFLLISFLRQKSLKNTQTMNRILYLCMYVCVCVNKVYSFNQPIKHAKRILVLKKTEYVIRFFYSFLLFFHLFDRMNQSLCFSSSSSSSSSSY